MKFFNFFLLLAATQAADVEYCQTNDDCPNMSGDGTKCAIMWVSAKSETDNKSGTVLTCIEASDCSTDEVSEKGNYDVSIEAYCDR